MSTAATATPQMLPSSKRPIPLTMRNDLIVKRIEYLGVGTWVIKDPVGLNYHRLQPEQYEVLKLLNAKRSLEEIRDELKLEFPTLHFTLADVQHLIADLHDKGLVFSNRIGQGGELIKKHRKKKREKLLQSLKNILYLRLPGWDPERTLNWLYPFVRWMFRPWAVVTAMVFVASAMILLGVQFEEFHRRLPAFQQFFGWPNLLYMWCGLGIAKIIHEFGHGISCKHFGGECHEMGMMLLVFSPCLYCDVSDSWMLKNKWHRIIIAAAGMYIEVILSAIMVYVWWNTEPGLLNHLALNIFFVTTVTTVIFNANPLMRFDGYYMMSDWLEIPNLRPKADKMLREKFAWYCLGIEPKPDAFMPETGRGWFVLFAISAAIYRWFILFGITIFLYTVLKPYGLQSIGIAMAVISIGGIISNMVLNVYRIITAPRSDPLSYPKIAITLVVLTAVIVGVIMIPLPLHVESSFLIEPDQVQHVYTTTPGQLAELKVKPGDKVREGQVLAVLKNDEIEDEYQALLDQRARLKKEADTYFALEDQAQEALARDKIKNLDAQIAERKTRLAQLTITAPCDGTVVEPPRIPEPKTDKAFNQLKQWHGTPLEPRNMGCFLQERTHLLSVAPNDKLAVVMIIDQADRNDVRENQEVEIKFSHLADKTYTGTIREISDKHLEFVPPPLSNKYGGDLPTVTDDQGRERLSDPAYQATIILEEDTHLLKSGIRGKARCVIERRTAGQWLWRYLRRTFHFRL
ncbi:MAG: hemolysin D [Planctomycetaceae bacterium]